MNKYDFRTNQAVNRYRKAKDYKTPRVVDNTLNSKLLRKKKSSDHLKVPYKSNYSPATSGSFLSKKIIVKKNRYIKDRKKSCSSSPDIRTTPNNQSMSKKLSKNDFGYVNPKRKSYNTENPLTSLHEKKGPLPSKTTAASIKSSALGSGRSTALSNVTGGKYMPVKGSKSFIESVAKRNFDHGSIDHILNINLKHGGITAINEESYRTPATRNIPKGAKSPEDISKMKLGYKKKSMMGIT